MKAKSPRSKRTIRQRNPSESYIQAKELSEKFHGRDSQGTTNVRGVIKFNKNITDLGDLEDLWILNPTGAKAICIPFDSDRVRLTSTPDGCQLLVVGLNRGATEIDLDGIPWLDDGEKTKQLIQIGEIFQVGYFTDKHHLEGPETQKDGSGYDHQFGKGNGIRPLLVYDQLNQKCLFVGGAYTVEDIGIVG